MIKIYGIPNCSTVKKARQWLTAQHITAQFIDFKKEPPSESLLRTWLQHIPLSDLINRRGTTWRKLSPQQQELCNNIDTAIDIMHHHPSLIKRPVLMVETSIYVGFDEDQYARIFHL